MKKYAFAIKMALTIVFLVLGYFLIEINLLLSAIKSASWPNMLLAFLGIMSIRLLMAIRWKVFLDAYQIPITLLESIKVILASGAVGFFSPGGILADVFKGARAYQSEQNVAKVASIVIFDKLVGIFSMILLVAISTGTLIQMEFVTSTIMLEKAFLFTSTTAACALVALLLLNIYGDRIQKNLEKSDNKIGLMTKKIITAILIVSKKPLLMIKVTLVSLLMQIMRSVTFYFILSALGIGVALLAVLAYFPIVFMSMLLPITIGGLGVREGATYILFQQFGVNLEMSIASGLLFYALQTIAAVLGLVVFILDKEKKKAV